MSAKNYDIALVLSARGREVERVTTRIDIADDGQMQGHLSAAMKRNRIPDRKRREYSLVIYAPRNRRSLDTWAP